ncbi:ATP phosphoribosyltransferase regulatory subunit [Bathymodiolus heckerae thiotrophic gill symbiont]|uniref:ATP phosphoribosyltransferase regulatory subunit n=1 Tax=Bathymodiolus heckerae thiotrophic gill symbiont TaxID=1052212 RepID=UPI0010B6DC35|nr:ATP phosphoribosyltransferase regulatory subunit [Bathymodiolus heckerae thiotrophic gill symbiont]CAC9544372.1 ATP phosphoribosyltransferase regulatory subunit (EC 2.4.2.17) [uncultured Gammaproteobacteria bacterium]CAC9957718.1 ATP phosphoribosyltransferase regulatory subunit (EC 2.4.2.17) [uncultured Gammaproteobacteria bacterium]SHN90440.1 ATP phosphoribosyltransferase regulatory subunit [Bathymodiolus heckerae thiotrophic gill symbiont]
MSTWQLPEGIDELSGDQAMKFEMLRRSLIDLYTNKGFGLVVPPMVEHVDSLLLTSDAVNEKTFKFLDPASGKMLGVHADITPQIARIDAKRNSNKVEKYCYINAILQTRADDFYDSRSPIQAGAELYGSTDTSADVEVIELMLESLNLLAIDSIVISLGNVAIFDALITSETLNIVQTNELRHIFAHRSTPDLNVFMGNNTLNNAALFNALMQLEGDASVLSKALDLFKDFPVAQVAIKDLQAIDQALQAKGIQASYDLAELQTYEYHTGVVFSAYNKHYSKALAQGGRYNGIGESFGQSRAATGFSFDLKFLSQSK